jgi:hypothetical protein
LDRKADEGSGLKSVLAKAGKVLLLSESAMIRAPKQLDCGQIGRGVGAPA